MRYINDGINRYYMTAKEFFTQEWGIEFTKATLSEKNGLLELSMEDIYTTMEEYAELRLADVKKKPSY